MGKCKNYEELAHEWAYAPKGQMNETYGGHMFYDGHAIYSYGYHHCMMQRYPDLDVVLENGSTYSNTTAKHHSIARSAIPRGYTIIKVPYPEKLEVYKRGVDIKDHTKNLDYMLSEINRYAGLAERARTRKEEYEEDITTTLFEADKYINAFNLNKVPKKFIVFREIVDTLSDLIRSGGDIEMGFYETMQERRRKKELREVRKRNKKLIDETKEAIKVWLTGDPIQLSWEGTRLLDKVYLRIKGDEVETSSNASIPLKHAIIMYKRYKAGKEVVGHSIGYYTIRSLDKKNVQIGCHTIPMSEVHRVMKEVTDG